MVLRAEATTSTTTTTATTTATTATTTTTTSGCSHSRLTPSVHPPDLLLLLGHVKDPLQLEGRVHDEGVDIHETATP